MIKLVTIEQNKASENVLTPLNAIENDLKETVITYDESWFFNYA